MFVQAYDSRDVVNLEPYRGFISDPIFLETLQALAHVQRGILLDKLTKEYKPSQSDEQNAQILRPTLQHIHSVDQVLQFIKYVQQTSNSQQKGE